MTGTDFNSTALADHPDLEGAIEACFDAVVTPQTWQPTLERLSVALGALALCFHCYGATPDQRMRAPMSRRYQDMLEEFLPGGWAGRDLRAARGWPLIERGQTTLTEGLLTTAQERANTPIYAELFRRHELDCFAATALYSDGQRWAFNIVRSQSMGDVADTHEADVNRLTLARPYLTRMLNYSAALSGAAQVGALEAMMQSRTAALVLNAQGRIEQVNDLARDLLGDGLSEQRARLVAERPDSQAALEARIAAALSGEGGRLGVNQGPLAVPTRRGGILLVDVTPLKNAMADAFGRTGALVTLVDPLRRTQPSASLLRRLYGLTLRESEVAVMVAGGEGIAEMAQALGLRDSSTRQIVKALLWKTGARRQSELTALFAQVPGDA